MHACCVFYSYFKYPSLQFEILSKSILNQTCRALICLVFSPLLENLIFIYSLKLDKTWLCVTEPYLLILFHIGYQHTTGWVKLDYEMHTVNALQHLWRSKISVYTCLWFCCHGFRLWCFLIVSQYEIDGKGVWKKWVCVGGSILIKVRHAETCFVCAPSGLVLIWP